MCCSVSSGLRLSFQGEGEGYAMACRFACGQRILRELAETLCSPDVSGNERRFKALVLEQTKPVDQYRYIDCTSKVRWQSAKTRQASRLTTKVQKYPEYRSEGDVLITEALKSNLCGLRKAYIVS